MADIKDDGSGSKRRVIESKNNQKTKILPFSTVTETDLKKVVEYGSVLENLLSHSGWGIVLSYIDKEYGRSSLIQAKLNKTLDDKMTEAIAFEKFTTWISQRVDEGVMAKEAIELRAKQKEDELNRKQKK